MLFCDIVFDVRQYLFVLPQNRPVTQTASLLPVGCGSLKSAGPLDMETPLREAKILKEDGADVEAFGAPGVGLGIFSEQMTPDK
jgi:hypothetical protein